MFHTIKKKWSLALILTFVMMLMIVPSSVFADGVTISNCPFPAVGESIYDITIDDSVAYGGNYQIMGHGLEIKEGGSYTSYNGNDKKVEYDKTYALYLQINMNSGSFDDDVSSSPITVNDKNAIFISQESSSIIKIRVEFSYESPVTEYDLWVGNIRVTSNNASDVLGDSTVSYDAKAKILTLNDCIYQDSGSTIGDEAHHKYAGINIGIEEGITLNLIGNNRIIETKSNDYLDEEESYSYGIYATTPVTVVGSGDIYIAGGAAKSLSCGFYSTATLTTSSDYKGDFIAMAGKSDLNYGIFASSVVINGGAVGAISSIGDESYGIGSDEIIINNGKFDAAGSTCFLADANTPITLGEGIYARASENKLGDNYEDYDSSKSGTYKWFQTTKNKTIYSVELTLEIPSAGTIVTVQKDESNELDIETQNPYPVVTLSDDVNYGLYDEKGELYGNWYANYDEREILSGEMLAGETYYAEIWLEAKSGFGFSNSAEVEVNSGNLKCVDTDTFYNGGLMFVVVPVTIQAVEPTEDLIWTLKDGDVYSDGDEKLGLEIDFWIEYATAPVELGGLGILSFEEDEEEQCYRIYNSSNKHLFSMYLSGDEDFVVAIADDVTSGDNIIYEITDEERTEIPELAQYKTAQLLFDVSGETTEETKPLLKVQVIGNGQISVVEDGETPEFSDEYPMQSFASKVVNGTKMILAAKADKDYQFEKWTISGDESFSNTNEQITVEVTKDVTYVANFKYVKSSSSSGGSSSSSYKVKTKTDNENVEITPKNPSVKKNSSQEFTFTPKAGFEITDVLVDGKSVGAVNKYTLEKVTAKHIIEVKTQKVSAIEKVDDWAKEEVAEAEKKGLIPETFIKKDATEAISRADFCAVAVKLYESLTGKKAEKASSNPFTDTNDDNVLKAYALGITKGISGTEFGNGTITREQMATMIARALKIAGIDTTIDLENVTKFADDNEMHDWGRPSIYFMVKVGIIKGVGDNKFNPLGLVKVEEALAIILRCLETYAK